MKLFYWKHTRLQVFFEILNLICDEDVGWVFRKWLSKLQVWKHNGQVKISTGSIKGQIGTGRNQIRDSENKSEELSKNAKDKNEGNMKHIKFCVWHDKVHLLRIKRGNIQSC